ncbi:tuftelin-interacting protein [Blastocystis sp. ATCC 50177/Nand II]|uniref:Tuftelin-interacting protein n=1 Tax=Blastocystis sp. subtype 1 (strain ATCC 50177 / NandII) TaxID=478820 RepID=A0A196SKF4_BLAHN|nr:tuftelin-interacting protein [Blastocystis sp. ATCC 50177/Nand II]
MSEMPLFEKKEQPEKKEEAPLPSNMGAWQRHTTGFGEKFMRKFGFEGRLGKDGQGIAQPIATKKRPEGLGLGADGFREATTLKANKEIAKQYNKNAGIQTEEEPKKKKDWWKDSGDEDESDESDDEENAVSATDSDVDNEERTKKKKDRRVFKTLEQLLQEQSRGEETDEVKPIVFTDHTGRQAQSRVWGENDLSSVNRNAVGFELVYNLESLTSLEESRLLQLGSKNRRREETKREQQEYAAKLKAQIDAHTEEIHNLEAIAQRVRGFREAAEPKDAIDVLVLLESLQIDFPVEYYRYKLQQLVPSLLQPALLQTFAHWEPLQNAHAFSELMDHVQDVLWLDAEEDEESRLFSYDWSDAPPKPRSDESHFVVVHAFTATVLPMLSRAVKESFNLFDDTHFANYKELLLTSRRLWDSTIVMEKLTKPVLQKIKAALNDWSLRAAVDHGFFFRTLLRFQTLLPGFESEIFPLFTTRITAFVASLPSLAAAREFISSVKPLYDAELQSARRSLFMLENAVLPQLARGLREFEVDPGNQEHIETFIETMRWCECVDAGVMSALLEGEFFNKWLFVLYSWMHQPSADLAEIVNWIEGWRSLLPPALLENEYVQRQFNRCWDIVNEVLDGKRVVDPRSFEKRTSYISVIQSRRIEEKEEMLRERLRQEARETSAMELRDAMAMWGEKNNVELTQLENRTADGNTLYAFGSVEFYILDNVAYVRSKTAEGAWEPKSMREMLEMNRQMEEDPLD